VIERHRRERGGSAVGATIEAPKAPRGVKIATFGAFWAAIFTVQRTVLYADHAA